MALVDSLLKVAKKYSLINIGHKSSVLAKLCVGIRAVRRIFVRGGADEPSGGQWRRRRRRASAAGARIEALAPRGVGAGGGVPLPRQLGGLGERCKLPQWGPGRSPGRFWFFNILKPNMSAEDVKMLTLYCLINTDFLCFFLHLMEESPTLKAGVRLFCKEI